MPAFKKLGPGDQIDNVLVLEPQWDLASGSSGWHGSPEGSASVNLYGGVARQTNSVVRRYDYQPLIPASRMFGQMSRANPITASVDFVWMTNEDLDLSQRTRTRWGYEHWKTVMGLYDFYSRQDPDYTTSSYDHYVLYFQQASSNIVAVSSSAVPQPTGSFTVESWVKPFITASAGDLTIQSRNNVFWLGITGSTGRLAFSSSYGVVTASSGPSIGDWSHVAVAYDATTLGGIFYLNLQNVGTFTMSPLTASVSATLHTIGNRIVGNGGSPEGSWSTGSANRSFHGFIGESRLWGSYRSHSQVSSSHNHRLTGSDLGVSQVTLWFNDGPLSKVDGYVVGSGALDASQTYNGASFPYAQLRGFNDRLGPVWHPSDNTAFYVPKQLAVMSQSLARMIVVSVPSAISGRQIVPNSLRLTCNTYNSQEYGLRRVLIDDGRGNLFLSGSAATILSGGTPASGTYSIAPANTSSISFQARAVGSSVWSVGAAVAGLAGSHTWLIDETTPASVIITVPCFSDGVTPSETMQSFYDFIDGTSQYIKPTSISAPNDITGFTSFTVSGGTATDRSTPASGSYRGVEWNKVGNVFYNEGLVVIRDPALLDFAATWPSITDRPPDTLQLSFRTQSRIPVKTVVARIDRGDLNRSLNPTYYTVQEDGYRAVRHPSGNLYVTTVGLYNSDHELVGVARLAEPLRVRPRDRLAVKIRMDF